MQGVRVVLGGILIAVAAILELSWAPYLAVGGASPDFLLLLVGAYAAVAPPPAATWMGFGCGLVYGALSGANLTSYVLSRTLAAYLGSSLRRLHLEFSLFLSVLLAVGVVASARVILMFLAPPPSIPEYLRDTMGTAFYNGVLALPVCALLRKLYRPAPV